MLNSTSALTVLRRWGTLIEGQARLDELPANYTQLIYCTESNMNDLLLKQKWTQQTENVNMIERGRGGQRLDGIFDQIICVEM